MICDHYCNNPIACPTCTRRFWKWAENHTRGRGEGPSFYDCAARFVEVDNRSEACRG
jgi:hypothetical protein